MKTKTTLGAIALSIASFTGTAHDNHPGAEQTGRKIFTAFQHNAFMEYNSFIPTLPQLLQVMDDHPTFYGAYLAEAKAEISKQYDADVSRIETSFVSAVEQGKLDHIAWSKAKFVSAERTNETLTITFTVNSETHRIRIAVTEIEGELMAGKVLQFFPSPQRSR